MHTGHRSRLIGRVAEGGTLYSHELLETLLFPACPRRDLNPLAHRILEKFKTLGGVFCASADELATVEGVGGRIADYLVCLGKCLPFIGGGRCFTVIGNTEQFERFILSCAATCEDELILCICDSAGRMTRKFSFRGKNGGRPEATAEDLAGAIAVSKAHGVFAGYRYARGGAPSAADDELALAVDFACRLNGASFFDYVVFSSTGQAFSYFVTDRLEHGFRGA